MAKKELKIKDTSKLLEMTEKEFKKELRDSQKKMYETQMKLQANELKQTHLVKGQRKYIAVLNTIATSKWYTI